MKDLTGQRFGKLIVINKDSNSTIRHPKWLCQCDCGQIKSIRASALVGGLTRSCGCLRRETMDSKIRLYQIWKQIRQRALKHTSKSEHYFDRGITMCDEWANNFKSFKEWSLANGYNDNLSIDRIDNNKGYYPENCRWVDTHTQSRNKRNNVVVTINMELSPTGCRCHQHRERGLRYDSTRRRSLHEGRS